LISVLTRSHTKSSHTKSSHTKSSHTKSSHTKASKTFRRLPFCAKKGAQCEPFMFWHRTPDDRGVLRRQLRVTSP